MTDLADGTFKMFLFMRRPDGSSIGYPMTGLVRDGVISFTTYRKAAKARYLLADDRVCCVVVDRDNIRRGTIASGRAYPIEGTEFTAATRPGESRFAVPTSVTDAVRDRLESGKRMAFRVALDETRPVRRVEVPDAQA